MIFPGRLTPPVGLSFFMDRFLHRRNEKPQNGNWGILNKTKPWPRRHSCLRGHTFSIRNAPYTSTVRPRRKKYKTRRFTGSSRMRSSAAL